MEPCSHSVASIKMTENNSHEKTSHSLNSFLKSQVDHQMDLPFCPIHVLDQVDMNIPNLPNIFVERREAR